MGIFRVLVVLSVLGYETLEQNELTEGRLNFGGHL